VGRLQLFEVLALVAHSDVDIVKFVHQGGDQDSVRRILISVDPATKLKGALKDNCPEDQKVMTPSGTVSLPLLG
jgi:hypothetical protein